MRGHQPARKASRAIDDDVEFLCAHRRLPAAIPLARGNRGGEPFAFALALTQRHVL
jgi:hypothetical protein